MTRRERCNAVAEVMETGNPEDADRLRKDLDEFFVTRNLLCHQPGAADETDHLSFQQRCSQIQRCLKVLENQRDD
jgi:hypothetical protein